MKKKRSVMHSIAAAPHIFWAILFIVLPLIIVIFYAFTDDAGAFSLENIMSLGEYVPIFVLSLELSVIATFVCLLVGYPLAYIMARAKPEHQKIFVMLLMLPMWTNLLIRTYSIMAILDDGGLINTILGTSMHIVGTKGAVIFGMIYNYLPFMVLPIHSVLSKMDHRLTEAAHDLGCNRFEALTRVTLPLSLSGIISGVTMVFVPSISTFYISQKLGGGTIFLIGDTIELQFQNPSTYNVGAAISLVMMVLILISVAVMNHFSDGGEDEGGIIP